MDERKWIERILAGDTQVSPALSRSMRRWLIPSLFVSWKIARRQRGCTGCVREDVSCSFRFSFRCKFSTWFYRIVYRTALTALRQQRMFVSYEEAGPVDLSNDEVESATAFLEREDRKEMIARTLKKLPADEALLLTLYYLEECSVEEICQITELSASNVKVKLFRGRKRFYEVLQDKMKLETADLL